MKKYKKIFSGLGLLSITTLMGASIVACSPKEEKPKQGPEAPGTDGTDNKGPKAPKTGQNNSGTSTEKEKADKAKSEKEKVPSSIELLGFDKEDINKVPINKSITREDFERQINGSGKTTPKGPETGKTTPKGPETGKTTPKAKK